MKRPVIKNVKIWSHPPYSQDMAPWDFFLTVKMTVENKQLEWIQEIEAARRAQLKTFMKGDCPHASGRARVRRGVSKMSASVLKESNGEVPSIINFKI